MTINIRNRGNIQVGDFVKIRMPCDQAFAYVARFTNGEWDYNDNDRYRMMHPGLHQDLFQNTIFLVVEMHPDEGSAYLFLDGDYIIAWSNALEKLDEAPKRP